MNSVEIKMRDIIKKIMTVILVGIGALVTSLLIVFVGMYFACLLGLLPPSVCG